MFYCHLTSIKKPKKEIKINSIENLEIFYINDKDKEIYLLKFYKKYNFLYDKNFSYNESFDYLSSLIKIKDKFEEFIMHLGHFKKGNF